MLLKGDDMKKWKTYLSTSWKSQKSWMPIKHMLLFQILQNLEPANTQGLLALICLFITMWHNHDSQEHARSLLLRYPIHATTTGNQF